MKFKTHAEFKQCLRAYADACSALAIRNDGSLFGEPLTKKQYTDLANTHFGFRDTRNVTEALNALRSWLENANTRDLSRLGRRVQSKEVFEFLHFMFVVESPVAYIYSSRKASRKKSFSVDPITLIGKTVRRTRTSGITNWTGLHVGQKYNPAKMLGNDDSRREAGEVEMEATQPKQLYKKLFFFNSSKYKHWSYVCLFDANKKMFVQASEFVTTIFALVDEMSVYAAEQECLVLGDTAVVKILRVRK